MPKRKTSSGPQPMDCSDGAKMLIEQMKEHPEEFRGYGGKFTSTLNMARGVTHGGDAIMSKRDAAAILAAAEEHLYEVWLAEDVLTAMMAPKEAPEKAWGTTTGRSVNKLGIWQGALPPGSVITANTASNSITAQYEQAHQRLLEKQRMEALERQESEYAMRDRMVYKAKDRYNLK